MKKNKTPAVHTNVLIDSSPATVTFIKVVNNQFIDVLNTYLRVHGVELVPPRSLDRDMLLWRTVVVRYKSGDCRHTQDEYESIKRIAQWIYEIHCGLTGQKYTPLEFA